ncbi:MAG: hypothetical protein IPQ07_06195 [Myxococcales bacterium]|nr:hypothetical protein [Myxococcales bacterium]
MDEKLELLLADGVIDEVLGRLKSGKEANISLVRRGDMIVAAKVYKDRSTRSFKNNAEYKEGRKVRNSRTQRAMDGGGKFGRDAAEQEWKSAESDALYKLVGSGVRVPEPVLFYEGVLLMDLVLGADGHPAPRMIDVALDKDAALGVYADLCSQIIAMLCCDLIHGDLSPYNILASAEGPTIIDFPQVISAVHNTRAEFFFLRDFDNVVRFISGFDPALAVHTADGRAIWRAYVNRDLTPQFIPPPPPPPRPTRGPDRRSRPDDRGRNGQRPPQRDGRPQQRDGRPQQRDGQRPPQRDGRPPQQRDLRPPLGADGRPLAHDGRAPQPNPRPPLGADGRPLAHDPRPPQRSDRPSTGGRGPQRRNDGGPSPQRSGPPPLRMDPRPPSRPAPPRPGPARSAEGASSPSGGHRRRPKRRW